MLQKSFKSDIIKLVKLLTEVVLVEYSANLTLVANARVNYSINIIYKTFHKFLIITSNIL